MRRDTFLSDGRQFEGRNGGSPKERDVEQLSERN